ncbi:type V toxin-antitoxin system endoribonuclease antitoxin GhoS [Morganella morganii]
MSEYLVRVELYDAGIEDYEFLHNAMSGIGMHKFLHIQGLDLKALPDGTYFGASSLTAIALRDRVFAISRPLSSDEPSIFVAQVSDWASYLHSLN